MVSSVKGTFVAREIRLKLRPLGHSLASWESGLRITCLKGKVIFPTFIFGFKTWIFGGVDLYADIISTWSYVCQFFCWRIMYFFWGGDNLWILATWPFFLADHGGRRSTDLQHRTVTKPAKDSCPFGCGYPIDSGGWWTSLDPGGCRGVFAHHVI